VVDCVAFAPDNIRLITSGTNVPALRYKPDNRGIDVWDLSAASTPVNRLLPDRIVTGITLNPLGRWLYVGIGHDYGEDTSSSGYRAVDLVSGEETGLGTNPGNGFTLDVHPSGRRFVGADWVQGFLSGRIVCWEHSSEIGPKLRWEFVHQSRGFFINHLACDPASGQFVTHDLQAGLPVTDQVYELTIRDPDTGHHTAKVPIPGRTVEQLLFSPDGSWLVARAGRSLLVWDSRELVRKSRKVGSSSPKNLTGVAFHPSGRFLAATSNDTTVKLYDTDSWQLAKTFTWDVGRLRSVAFSPDGTRAAVGSVTGTVVVWDVDL
jgi:WD40 repeat protein